MKLGSLWRLITRRLTLRDIHAPLDEDIAGAAAEHRNTLDKARLDALSSPGQRIDDWQAPLDDR